MTELDQKIVTCKLRVERLTNELLLATAELARLGFEKEALLVVADKENDE